MLNIEDWSNLPLSDRNGTYGGMAGAKRGLICNNEPWMIKLPKRIKRVDVSELSYTTSPLSEYIGSQIYSALGFDTHETKLIEYEGKIAVACKDFRKNNEMLLEIRTIKNAVNEELAKILEKDFSGSAPSHLINLDEMLLHIDYNDILNSVKGLKERFWDCVVVDALINNNDRNDENWGILRCNGRDRLAPIFGNGASFSDNLSENMIEDYMQNPEKIRNSALNTATAFHINGKPVCVRFLFEDYENSDFKAAIMRNIPLIKNNMEEICKIIDNIPEIHNGKLVCSKQRAEFYKIGMIYRMNELMVPCYNRIRKCDFSAGGWMENG